MDIFDIDPNSVDEPKDFSAIKAGLTRIRCVDVQTERKVLKSTNTEELVVTCEYEITDPASIETVDGSAPGHLFNRLYTHSDGALKMVRKAIESHGLAWTDFIAGRDWQMLNGLEADVKVKLITKNHETGEELDNPRNEINFKLPKKESV